MFDEKEFFGINNGTTYVINISYIYGNMYYENVNTTYETITFY